MADNKDRKLNEEQQSFVALYCDSENSKTFLNHYESYKGAGYKQGTSMASKAARLLNKGNIQEAIKKKMPKVAYSEYILRREYMNLYTTAKNEGNLGVAAKLLDSMAKTERMFADKASDEDSSKTRNAIEEATKERLAEIKARKEGKVVDFQKNGTE
jgi:phage terminase small subunit